METRVLFLAERMCLRMGGGERLWGWKEKRYWGRRDW